MKWFLTADVHGDVWELKHRIDNAKIPDGSNIVVLGELSVNYWLDKSDARKKKFYPNYLTHSLLLMGTMKHVQKK